MKKNMRMMLSLLLVLVLMFQLTGSLALADDVDVTLSGKESLVYELFMTDPENADSVIPVGAEEESEKLGGKTCSVTLGRADAGASDPDNSAMSRTAGSTVLEDLLKKNLFITPPEGYYVKSAYLRGDAVETQARKVLPFTADAEKTTLTLKAGAVEGRSGSFDKKYLTTASTVNPPIYTLVIVIAPLEKEKNLTVTEALDPNAPGADSSLAPGSTYTAPIAPADTETQKFKGWQLSYKNGGSLKLEPGQSVKPYADCRVEALWTEIITISANAPVQEGENMVSNGWTYTGKLGEGDLIDSVALNVAEQDGGFVAVPYDAVILRDGKNVTELYELRYENSVPVQKEGEPTPGGDDTPVTPEPVKLTVTAKEPITRDGGKTYEQDGAMLTAGELNEGDAFASIAIDVMQNENGNYVAVPRDAVIKNGDADNTANYEITYEASAEVVPSAPEPVKLTVTAKEPVTRDGGKTYEQDGAMLTAGTLNEGDSFVSIVVDVKQNEDGTFVAVPRDAVIKNGEADNTANYEITYEASKPVTPPAPEPVKITITAKEPVTKDGGKTYEQDGAILTAGTLNEGDAVVTIQIDVKQNEDGSFVATPRDAVIKNGDADNTANYEISYEPSKPVTPPAPEKVKLTVTAKEPVTKDEGKTYEQNGALLTAGALNEGDAFVSIVIDVKQNEDGTFVATPRDAVIKNGDKDNTANYEITYESSKPVTPPSKKIPITIRSKDRSAEYTGKPITADAYELVSGALSEGHSIEVTYEGGSTNVTTNPVASPIASVVIRDALNQDVTNLYEITLDNENAGKVTVTKRSITVTAITGTVETDGTKVIYAKDCKTANGTYNHGHKVEGLLEGHELRGDFVKGYGSETFTTSIDLSALRIVDTTGVETDVTANYDIKTVDGKMTIKVTSSSGVPVAVTVKDQSWTYNGAANKPDQTGYNISGLLDGDVATVTLKVKSGETVSETATNAGTYTIVAEVTIRSKDGAAVADSKYKINAGTGTLTVKKLDITLEAVSDSKPYDGKALVNDKVKAPALAAGHKYSGVKLNVYDAKGNLIRNGVKEVGTYTKKITEVHILDSQGVEVTDNYNITKIDGKLTIMPSDKNNSTSPKTGDSSNQTFFIVVIVVCLLLLAAIATLLILQKRKARSARMMDPEEDEYYEDDGGQNLR